MFFVAVSKDIVKQLYPSDENKRSIIGYKNKLNKD